MSVIDHKCPSCNANLPYNPTTGKWDCEYCGNSFTLQELIEIEDKNNNIVQELDVYLCPDCGAKVVADENTSATFCVFCGNTNIIKERLIDEFEPDEIIPFKIDKKTATDIYKQSINQKKFLPSKFKKKSTINKITGVYVPFWLFNCEGTCELDTNAEKVSSSRRDDHEYTTTKEYQLLREAKFNFEKLPIDGLEKLENELIYSVEPFDYKDMQKFNLSYLAGFLAKKYDIDQKKAYEVAEDRMKETIRANLMETMSSYSSVSEGKLKVDSKTNGIKYALLPIWLLNVQYKYRNYKCVINGQTGKYHGKYPISILKVIACFLFFFLIPFVTCLGIMNIWNLYHEIILKGILIVLLNSLPILLMIASIMPSVSLISNVCKLKSLRKELLHNRKERNRIREEIKKLENEKKHYIVDYFIIQCFCLLMLSCAGILTSNTIYKTMGEYTLRGSGILFLLVFVIAVIFGLSRK